MPSDWLKARAISSRACASGLPCSRVSSRASESWCCAQHFRHAPQAAGALIERSLTPVGERAPCCGDSAIEVERASRPGQRANTVTGRGIDDVESALAIHELAVDQLHEAVIECRGALRSLCRHVRFPWCAPALIVTVPAHRYDNKLQSFRVRYMTRQIPTCKAPDPDTRKPRYRPPPLACDAHCHIFGPGALSVRRGPHVHAARCAAGEVQGSCRRFSASSARCW